MLPISIGVHYFHVSLVWLPVFGIFNMRTDVNTCDCTWGPCGRCKRVCPKSWLGEKFLRESALKVDWEKKILAAWGNQTHVSIAPVFSVRRSTSRDIPTPLGGVLRMTSVLKCVVIWYETVNICEFDQAFGQMVHPKPMQRCITETRFIHFGFFDLFWGLFTKSCTWSILVLLAQQQQKRERKKDVAVTALLLFSLKVVDVVNHTVASA